MFDGRCARVILDKSNEVAYSTTFLDALHSLADCVELILAQVDDQKRDALKVPPRLETLVNGTSKVSQAIKTRSNSTLDLPALQALRGLNEADTNELELAEGSLQKLRETAPEVVAQTELKRAGAHEQRLRQLSEFSTALSSERVASIQKLATDFHAAKNAASELAKQALATCPLDGVGTGPWRALYDAAREYSTKHAYPDAKFPKTDNDARCPLCTQSLEDDGRERFRSFDKVMSAEAERIVEAADRQLKAALQNLAELPAKEIFDGWLEQLATHDPTLGSQTQSWLELAFTTSLNAMQFAEDPTTSVPPPLPEFPGRAAVQATLQRHNTTASQATARSNPTELRRQREALEIRIAELKHGKLLDEHWSDIQDYGKSLTRGHLLSTLLNTITTQKVRQFQTKLTLSQHIESKINAELDGMQYGGLRPKVKTSSSGGPARQSIKLNGAKRVADILSEGEQRVLSLVMFLTEVGEAPGRPGIVLDDPVSSLDEEWMAKIAARLVREAASRQVIVFTHSISFLSSLKEEAAEQQRHLALHSVNRHGQKAGFVTENKVWEAMTVNERVGWLNARIQCAKAVHAREPHSTEYLTHMSLIADRTRATWERLVEEGMFGSVVIRHRNSVKTQQLKEVAVNAEIYREVYWGMTNMSKITEAHDSSAYNGSQPPSPCDMKQWIEKLTKTLDLINTQKKATKREFSDTIKAPKADLRKN